MFYQNILTEISPYQVRVERLNGFGEHRHGDIELNYCVKGSFEVKIDKKKYEINEGEMVLVSPMVAHSFPRREDRNNKVMTVVLGVSLLKNFFSYFSKSNNDVYLISKKIGSDVHEKLYSVLDETVELCQQKDRNNDLLIRGNLYKICSYLIDVIAMFDNCENAKNKALVKVANIEKALEMIYYDHAKPLTVDDAAAATGYGKSNFCKIFKSITGDTFHNVLNRQRVESACGLLGETNIPISEIATLVGFCETKTFCRVFKSVTAHTPGQYRKMKNTGR